MAAVLRLARSARTADPPHCYDFLLLPAMRSGPIRPTTRMPGGDFTHLYGMLACGHRCPTDLLRNSRKSSPNRAHLRCTDQDLFCNMIRHISCKAPAGGWWSDCRAACDEYITDAYTNTSTAANMSCRGRGQHVHGTCRHNLQGKHHARTCSNIAHRIQLGWRI